MADDDHIGGALSTLRFLPYVAAILAVVSSSTAEPSPAQIREAEALLAFKGSFLGPGGDGMPIALNSWAPGTLPCQGNSTRWRGVTCNDNGFVIYLQLEGLALSSNKVNMATLVTLTHLHTVSLVGNDLWGPLPDVGALTELRMLYLSGNRFTGHVPDNAFDGLTKLRAVHLARNELWGPIPRSILQPPRLMEFVIDHNHFDGAIPDFWQPYLQVIDFSYNNFSGSVPDRLSKFGAARFTGNKDLCGPPMQVQCPAQAPAATLYDAVTSQSPSSNILIIAIVILAIGSFLCIIGIILLLIAMRRKRQLARPLSLAMVDTMDGGGKAGKAPSGHNKLVFVMPDRREFGLEEMLRASAEVLGSNTFGSSYKAALFDGSAVVVKKFRDMNAVHRDDFHEHMSRLGRLSHPNVQPVVAYLYKKEEKLIVTDYVPIGSLAHVLHGGHSTNLLDWPVRLKIVKGVARGLAYLYQAMPALPVPHGYLKSSNVLLGPSLEPLLSDYALIPVMRPAAAAKVLMAYKSPEFVRTGAPSNKSDVWSLGILMLEVLTGKFPTICLQQGVTGTESEAWVQSVVGGDNLGLDPAMSVTKQERTQMLRLLNIALKCCEEDPAKRWDIETAAERIEEITQRAADGGAGAADNAGGNSRPSLDMLDRLA